MKLQYTMTVIGRNPRVLGNERRYAKECTLLEAHAACVAEAANPGTYQVRLSLDIEVIYGTPLPQRPTVGERLEGKPNQRR